MKNNKTLLALIALLLLALAAAVVLLWPSEKGDSNSAPNPHPTVAAPIEAVGEVSIPNVDKHGRPRPIPVYEDGPPVNVVNEDGEVVDSNANDDTDTETNNANDTNAKADDADADNATASTDSIETTAPSGTSPVLRIPLVKEACPIEQDGSIGAPRDYTTACMHTEKSGGQAILSHSVRGPRTGVFDHLAEMPVGAEVQIKDRTFRIASVDIYENDKLPTSIWQEGRLSLITCTLQAKHEDDPKAGWTHTTVATLEEVAA